MAGELCEDPKSKIMVSSSGGFFYTDVSLTNPDPNQFTNQINGYESNPAEIFNMTTGMEMIGFSKNLLQHDQTTTSHDPSSGEAMWKELFTKASIENQSVGPSSSKDFYQQDHEFNNNNSNKADFTTGISVTSSENQLVGSNWGENRFLVHDDSSLRCVFPCEGDERPSQGLSLSLSSNKPSSIGLQSFQLRQTSSNEQQQLFVCNTSFRDGLFGKLVNVQENQIMRDGFLGKAANIYNNEGQFQIRNSKYLGLAQEILKEFCCLGTKQTADFPNKSKIHKSKQFVEDNGSNSSRKQPTVSSLEFMELQKTKTKLLSLLEEVEGRYKHYSDQMRGVVVSFEEVAGSGSAKIYSALASKAMSRHFKCLKDGILRQIQAMEEKDPVVLGTTRGETPRLRAIDQAIRQHRSFQQMSMLETHPWRPQRGLPERSVSVLRAWLFEHFLHPYPSDVDKHILARQTGLSRSQVSNWFINARVRLWKPMVEEMYLEEKKDLEETNNNMASSPDGVNMELNKNNGWHSRNASLNRSEDEKPTPAQLVRIDSECLSSIITNPNKNDISRSSKTLLNHHIMNQQHCGTIDLDFSSYNQLHSAAGSVSYANHDHDHHNSHNNNNHINFNGGGVSLTLGLQQNNINNAGSGVNLAFSPVASKSSLFYPRDHDDHIDECHPVQYSLLDGDQNQNQNLPYRNLMGAQLLHDLAG